MLKIKLATTGKKNERHYRIVVANARSKLTGKNLEIVGHFHPLYPKGSSQRLVYNRDKIAKWLKLGAQPTETVAKLLNLKLPQ